MGGNAIKGAVRLDKSEYYALETKVCDAFAKYGIEVFPVVAYADKSSFGDMDILVQTDDYSPSKIACILGATDVVRNGSVTSMGIPCPQGTFQVDVIGVDSPEWAEVYFSYNDLGNLMGRIAHKMGFKYGNDGLRYVVRDPDNPSYVVKEILVTYDYRNVFRWMGYCYLRYMAGWFDCLEDIFEYVADNPFFDPDIYLLQNRNHTARVRDRKRPTYTAFLKWLEDKPHLKRVDWARDGYKESMRVKKLKEAFLLWPEFEEEYKATLSLLAQQKKAKEWWNGDNVSAITGLTGKELGAFMSHFKKSFHNLPECHFYHWVNGPAGEGYREQVLLDAFEQWRNQ